MATATTLAPDNNEAARRDRYKTKQQNYKSRTTADDLVDLQEQQTIELEISSLQPHPMQAKFFTELNDLEIEQLAFSIRRYGLLHPIEVLHDRKTILSGHQRVRAFEHLGRTTIPAIVRCDLEGADELTIKDYLISDNL